LLMDRMTSSLLKHLLKHISESEAFIRVGCQLTLKLLCLWVLNIFSQSIKLFISATDFVLELSDLFL